MSATIATAYPPREALWDLDRFAVLEPVADALPGMDDEPGQVDWTEVHRVVERALAGMSRRITRDQPTIRGQTAKTSGRDEWMFSYCQFDVPADHSINGIGVGVLFSITDAGNTVQIEGDIVRDETGDVLFALDVERVPNRRLDVVAAAQQVAHRLSAQTNCVADGLQQPCWTGSD